MFSTPARRAFILFVIGALAAGLLMFTVFVIMTVGDCTSPGGDCYQRQKAQREENVDRLKQTSIAANWCTLREATSPPPPLFKSIQECVDRKLAQLDLGEKP